MPHRIPSTLSSVAVAVACAAFVMFSGAPATGGQSDDQVMRDMAASAPPSWIKWIGWARDGTRIAWRQGVHGTGNVPGRPIWIARLNKRGAIVDRHNRRVDIQKALDTRGIRRRAQAEIEEVSELDVLVRSRAGEVLAVAVRGKPPVLAILRKNGADYDVIARRQVIGPVSRLRVNAAEQPAGRLMAIVAHTGRDLRRQGSLFVVPLQPAVIRPTAAAVPTVPPPTAATPTARSSSSKGKVKKN